MRVKTLRRATAMLMTAGLVLGLGGVAVQSASAGATPTYQVTSSDGVYARSAPQQSAITGYGPGYGASVTYICYGWGDAVGPYNNSLWYDVNWSGGTTWINDHWLSDPEPANTPVPGVSECGQTTAPTPTPSPDVSNGSDPNQTQCDQSEVTLHSYHMTQNGNNLGNAYLRYSTACQTEWVTVTYNAGYYPEPSIWLQGQSGTNLYTSDYAPYQGKVWTWQLSNMGHRNGCGGVQMYHANPIGLAGTWAGWFYLHCG